MKSKLTISFILLFVVTTISSQTINFQNPSFEGTPAPHVCPPNWNACMQGYTPDTQPGTWGITLNPSDGVSYIGMVHQYNPSWQEGVSQFLSTPLSSGTNYMVSIDIATTALSGSGIVPGSVELQVWGGYYGMNTGCDKSELLWSSGDVFNAAHMDQWMTHTLSFVPTQNWDNILFLAQTLDTTKSPYLMLDNLVSGTVTPGINISVFQQPTCYNICDGSAYVSCPLLTPPLQYLWSTGATTSSVTNLCPGNLYVQVIDSTGMVYYDTTMVGFGSGISPLPVQQICIVTVDTATGKNMIVWEKLPSVAIDTFFVQRETAITNDFQTIGKKAYADLSTFIDVTSNPAQQSNRYIIKALDTCGRLTTQGTPHKTIHLTVSAGMGGAWNLSWDSYQGFSYPSYLIFRGTSPSTLSLLTSVSTSSTSYTDVSPPAGILYYAVVVQRSTACNPTDKILSGYFSSFSNAESTAAIGIQDNYSLPAFSVKPNPANDYFNIELNHPKYLGADFMLLDVTGRVVYSAKIDETNTKVSLQGINSGLYIGQIAKEGLPASSVRIVVSESFR